MATTAAAKKRQALNKKAQYAERRKHGKCIKCGKDAVKWADGKPKSM